MTSSAAMPIDSGITYRNRDVPARTSTSMISSVAYATEESASEEKTDKASTERHLISVEGLMRRLARHFGEDEDLWALTGLFHDLDQDHTADDPQRHARLAAEWLRDAHAPEGVINGVLAHAHAEYQTDLMSRAIVAADALAGLLVAAALPRPEKAAGL